MTLGGFFIAITPVCVPTDRNLTNQKVSRQDIGHGIE